MGGRVQSWKERVSKKYSSTLYLRGCLIVVAGILQDVLSAFGLLFVALLALHY